MLDIKSTNIFTSGHHKNGRMMNMIEHIESWILGALVTVVGYFLRETHLKSVKTAEELSLFKTHVAENYAQNDRLEEIKQIAQNTNKRVDDIYTILTKKQ